METPLTEPAFMVAQNPAPSLFEFSRSPQTPASNAQVTADRRNRRPDRNSISTLVSKKISAAGA
jgi:hypothetical protein